MTKITGIIIAVVLTILAATAYVFLYGWDSVYLGALKLGALILHPISIVIVLAVIATVLLIALLVILSRQVKRKTASPPSTPPSIPADPSKKDPNKEKMRLLKGSLIVYSILIIIGFLMPKILGLDLGIIAIIFSLGHLYASFDEVNDDEHAIVLCFGRILFQAKGGWIVVPTGVFKMVRVTRGLIRGEFGTQFTRRVDKSGNVVEVPDEGDTTFVFRQPFRPNFQSMKTLVNRGPVDQTEFAENLRFPEVDSGMLEALGNEPEHRPMTPDLRYTFTFKVVDMIHFYVNVDGQTIEEKLLNIAQLISDQCKAAISEIAGITTFGLFLTSQNSASARIRQRVEVLLGEEKSFSGDPEKRKRQIENYPYLGVDLNNTRMKDPGFPLRVNEAMADAAAAGHEKQKVIAASEGELIRLANEGEGRAQALLAELKAEAEGLLKLADAAGSGNGLEILRLRSFVEALQKGNANIVPADLSVFGSAITAAKALLSSRS